MLGKTRWPSKTVTAERPLYHTLIVPSWCAVLLVPSYQSPLSDWRKLYESLVIAVGTMGTPHESFELNESLNTSTSSHEMKPSVSRTPKVLNARSLGQSVSSVASIDSIGSSQKRSVTFSAREETPFGWGTYANSLSDPPVFAPPESNGLKSHVHDRPPEIPSDGEYSEDFDDGPADGPLASSASYAEDFEESTGEQYSLRTGTHGGPESPSSKGQQGTGWSAYNSIFDTSCTAYSDDFEQSSSKTRQGSSAGFDARVPASDIDKLLNRLASEQGIPTQISEIRHKLATASRALNQTGDTACDDAAVQLSLQLEEQLEQLEVDLISGERKRRVEEQKRLDEKQAARARAKLC